jgi:hypothetical protein
MTPVRYFFVHMRRTAGTALRYRLMQEFGDAIYPTDVVDGTGRDLVNSMYSTDYLRERLAARQDRIRIIMGHFPLCTIELLHEQFTTLTMLREPVERTLSCLRYHRERFPADRDKSFEEVYDDPFWFRGFLHNHMTKMLSLKVDDMTGGMGTEVDFRREHLERAKEALTNIDAVGLTGHFEDFCEELSERFGWDVEASGALNTSTPIDVTESFRARIAEDNAADIELYEFAEELVASRQLASREQ